jgi:RsiW-degrading membrane proteinase PrsW (M82 family)
MTPVVIRTSPRISAIRLALVAIFIAIFLGLLVLLLIGIETGPVALLLGFLTATIPVPLYIALVLWIDRYEGEPLWMLATAFLWGAFIATFAAFFLNTTAQLIVSAVASASAGEAFAAVISAPIVEETGKALILFIFFFWKKDEFDGVIDGVVYASLAALGFAMSENILYYGKAAAAGGGEALTATFILRGFFAPFSHPLFTSLTGIGLGLARQPLEWLRSLWRRCCFHADLHPGDDPCVLHDADRDLTGTATRRTNRARLSRSRSAKRLFDSGRIQTIRFDNRPDGLVVQCLIEHGLQGLARAHAL